MKLQLRGVDFPRAMLLHLLDTPQPALPSDARAVRLSQREGAIAPRALVNAFALGLLLKVAGSGAHGRSEPPLGRGPLLRGVSPGTFRWPECNC